PGQDSEQGQPRQTDLWAGFERRQEAEGCQPRHHPPQPLTQAVGSWALPRPASLDSIPSCSGGWVAGSYSGTRVQQESPRVSLRPHLSLPSPRSQPNPTLTTYSGGWGCSTTSAG